jgi:hypothetical protein
MEREAREEGGLVLVSRQVLGYAVEIVYSEGEKACFEKRSVFIAAEVTAQEMSIEPDHELVWLHPDEALNTLSPASHRWAVRRFLAERDAPSPPSVIRTSFITGC